ncbi:DeoR family transcriptional regulator [Defluviimonas sp. 20V17]|uniref:Diacylglycerol kinase n=1 Tax=Allgaiera indica TaxID=765699 RepID=A0AAN4UNX5_9RHOB|nr:diacylglycerol kinase family protein [Allgaiera indica]KDB04868.1 DeoR family transcriptional regulator [Defluviimonas sp. 20V17]GHD99052.1 diacylglycerol kinase [Allgaiera indica]SDW01260.1 diacylglycerol kinase (ATP) [Allgaiera indica]
MPGRHPRLASFVHAARGLAVLLRQPNAWLHLVAAAIVVALAAYLQVSPGEWLALILAIALVLAAEALNTAIEHVVDIASPEWSALARDAKDVAAAGVLICAIGALGIGLIVFVPRLI